MSINKSGETVGRISASVAALFAGIAVAEFAAQHPVASAEPVTPLSAESVAAICATDAAKMPSISASQGLSATVLSANKMRLSVSAQPESQIFADNNEQQCDSLSVTRSTSAIIAENGKTIGIARNILNSSNDTGKQIARTVHTGKIGCNKNIKVTFNTTARTPYQPNVDFVGHQYIKFKTSC